MNIKELKDMIKDLPDYLEFIDAWQDNNGRGVRRFTADDFKIGNIYNDQPRDCWGNTEWIEAKTPYSNMEGAFYFMSDYTGY